MPGDNEVRITLTDVYNMQQVQGRDFAKALSDQSSDFKEGLGKVVTALAVLTKSVEPQSGVNAEVFRRLLAVEKKVWALPSASLVIAIIGLAIAYVHK